MSQVVGFYRTRSEAERVRDELLAANFDRSDVRLFGGSNASGSSSYSSSSASGTSDDRGFWGSVKDFFGNADDEDRHLYAEAAQRGAVGVSVDTDTADEERRATEIMRRGSAVDLDQESSQWRKQGWSGRYAGAASADVATNSRATGAAQSTAAQSTTAWAATPTATGSTQQNLQGKEVIPVVEEQLNVGKRQVQGGGIRVHSRVTEKPVQEQVTLREEHVDVQRRPVDRPLSDADRPFQDRTIEARETIERPVVSKEARVVEEVTVGKDVQQRTETVSDKVRRTDVDVERIGQGAATTSGATSFSDPDAYASTLASDSRFRGRDWNTIETDARGDFERRYPGSKWEQFKDAIHRGYEKVKQKV